jgi:pyroglutamyl-peptidase
VSKKTLLTGFQAFGGDEVNPTELMLRWVCEDRELSQVFETQLLPVEYGAYELILRRSDLEQFENIFCLGLAGGRSKIGLERIGVNWVESRQPDNAGVVPPLALIDSESEPAIINEMNLEGMKKDFEVAGLPIEISLSAGGYVCNHLYFNLLNARLRANVLFIHVPYLAEQVLGKPGRIPSITEEQLKLFLRVLAKRVS